MKKNILITLLAALLLSSCGEYNKLLKSTDYEYTFFLIALFIGLCNLPFAAIQRYNRYRLLRLLRRVEAHERT